MAVGAIIGGLFGAFAKKKEIEANNAAAVSAYKATNAALTINQGINWQRATEATRETARETNMAIVEAKADITKEVSKAAIDRGEGVTAGISAARTVSNVLLQSSKAVEGVKEETQTKINEMWMATEEANYQLQQQKVSAYNNMKASLVTGTRATLQIIGQAVGGAQTGSSIGTAMGGMSNPFAQTPGGNFLPKGSSTTKTKARLKERFGSFSNPKSF